MFQGNPRDQFGRRHNERGPAKYVFTYNELAELVGMKVRSVHNAKGRGEFDPQDIGSVIRWAALRLGFTPPEDKT